LGCSSRQEGVAAPAVSKGEGCSSRQEGGSFAPAVRKREGTPAVSRQSAPIGLAVQ